MQVEMQVLIIPLIFLINVTANILIKKGASKKSIFFNKFTILGYFFFVVVLMLSMILIQIVKLQVISLIMAINYVMTYFAGVFFFKEKTNIIGVIGIIIVFLGIFIFSF